MKVAIFHDYFDKRGGGERLVFNMAKSLNACVYTGFIEKEKTFETNGIEIISLDVKNAGNILLRNKKIQKKFSELRLSGYDVYIFSGVWCLSAAKYHKPNILFLHALPRFMYDLKDYYMKKLNIMQRFFFKRFIDSWEPVFIENVKQFNIICPNSVNVKNRVLKYLGKGLYDKCVVMYVGFKTKDFYYKKPEGFYLSASRLDPLKRTEIIIDAFKINGKKLVVVGSGPDEKKMKRLAKGYENIKFLGNVSEEMLHELYATCNASVIAALDEDLGFVPLESHASGKPCIAVREGGFLETIKEGKNGVFFEPNTKSLVEAIEKCEQTKWNYKCIQKTAKNYDISVFLKKMKNIIKYVMQSYI